MERRNDDRTRTSKQRNAAPLGAPPHRRNAAPRTLSVTESTPQMGDYKQRLDALIAWRLQESRKIEKPAYTIFNNTVLAVRARAG